LGGAGCYPPLGHRPCIKELAPHPPPIGRTKEG